MSAHIGPIGQLVEFKCPSAIDVTAEPRSSFMTTMGGRVVEQRGPRGRREWSANIATALPEQVAGLEALLLGAWGSPPWVWVSPDAAARNLFTPGESILQPGNYADSSTPIGARTAIDGVRVPSMILVPPRTPTVIGDQDEGRDHLPVVAGTPMTASAYGSGEGGVLRLRFRDAAGGTLATHNKLFSASIERQQITGTPPSGAVDAIVSIHPGSAGPVRVGAPAATWTTMAMPWAVGRGCPKATVDGLSDSVQSAVMGDPGMNRSALSFTVKELG